MKTFLSFILTVCFFTAVAADPNYWATIKRQHRHLDCIYFDVEIWSDNGTPSDPNDDYVVGTGTVSKCDTHVNNGTPSNLNTALSTYLDPSTNCLMFEVSILDSEGNPYAEGLIGDDGC